MRIRWNRFNTYLLLAFGLAVAAGCRSPHNDSKKQFSHLALYQEASRDPSGGTEVVTVHKDPLIQLRIKQAPILTEAHVEKASLLDTMGGFAMSIQFDRQGSWLLEQYSSAIRGKHIAIFSQFVPKGEKKLNDGRWLAAPKILNHITDGC